MSVIQLSNTTGRRAGNFVRFEYGEDLFGYLFLDVIAGKRERSRLVRSMLFESTRDFICTLDLEIDRRESLNYFHGRQPFADRSLS